MLFIPTHLSRYFGIGTLKFRTFVRSMNAIINTQTEHIALGTIDYAEAWARQESLFNAIIAIKMQNRDLPESQQKPTPNYVLTCQHPHVYTLGKSGQKSNLLLSDASLQAHQAQFFESNRGGDITYHGPGQLVVYPILDLDNFFTDIHKYLRYLEEAVIKTLDQFQITGSRIDGLTGVWLDANGANPRKICAMGVRSSRWVTMHGLALNVHADLGYFNHIIPCGIPDKAVTSMHVERSQPMDMATVEAVLLTQLKELFGFQWLASADKVS